MRRMKKFATSIVLVGIMCGLAACGNEDKEVTTKATTEATTVEISEATEEKSETETTEATTTETKATEEETSEEKTADAGKAQPKKTDINFSTDDWKSLEFALDGKVYTWPLTLADVEGAGFKLDDDYKSETLESNRYTTSVSVESEAGERFYIRFKNFTDKDKNLVDCDLYGFGFEVDDYYDVNPDVTLCNGVTFGMSVDEVKAIMGEPDYYYESEDSEIDRKEMDYYVTGKSYDSTIDLSFTDGKLDEIDIVNAE